MKIFIDSGNIKDIETLVAIGIIDGVTTNPTLLAKEPGDYRDNLKKICQIVKGPVSGEVTAVDFAGMLKQGRDIAAIDQHMIVKVPLTRAGIQACKTLSDEGIRVNVTLCFSAAQALLAAKAGASYISPFVGRLDDISEDGIQVVRDTVEIYQKHHLETLVLAASIRHPLHIIDAAKAGAHIATVPFKVLEQASKHPLTDKGIENFLKDWEKFKSQGA
jgi:transaldolase